MILTLTAVSLNDRPLATPLTARFDDHGGTIGRADHNTLALPDPERFISRLQAEVVASGSGFLIRNVGSANAILVGAQTLASGQSSPLADGNELRIGGYLVHAQLSLPVPPSPDVTRPITPLHSPRAAPMAVAAPPLSPPVPPPAPARPAPQVPAAPLRAQAVTGLSEDNPFAELLGPRSAAPTGADPFADLFGAAAAPAAPAASARDERPPIDPPTPAGIDARSAALASPHDPVPAHRLPDDFDPFAAPPPAAASPAAPADPFADLMPGPAAPGIDQAFGLADGSPDDPLAGFLADVRGPAQAGAALSTDPLALFGGTPSPADAAAPAQPDHVQALHAAYTPPRVAPEPAAPLPARPMPRPMPAPTPAPAAGPWTSDVAGPPAASLGARMPSPPTGAVGNTPPGSPANAAAGDGFDAQALWDAFCAGAGIQLQLPPGSGPERMQAIGQMLRSAVEGTLKLMAVRASTKHELRADVTMIRQRNNNPLKFSPDATSGLEQLIQTPARGFLDGPAAIEEAMHDLVGHSIGTVAGMRAAIEGMLGRFDPAALESKLASGSMLDSLLPMSRRARLWDLYLQHHGAIRNEAQDDFHTLFGKAFLAAYEQQIERLRMEKKRP